MKRAHRDRQLSELAEVMSFFYLNYGCQHYRAAFYLSEGVLDSNIAIESCREVTPCNSCPVCDKTWYTMHPPFFRYELVRFLESSTGRSIFPMDSDSKRPLLSILSTRPYWIQCIFNRPACSIKVRIEATLLSLVAANIVRLEKSANTSFRWHLTWSDCDTPIYQSDNVWDGLHLLDDTTQRREATTNEEH